MQETYQQSAQDVLASLHSSPSGLTAEEAAARLDRHGPNKLQEAPKATLLQRFFQQLKDPMLLILMAAAAVSAHRGGYLPLGGGCRRRGDFPARGGLPPPFHRDDGAAAGRLPR